MAVYAVSITLAEQTSTIYEKLCLKSQGLCFAAACINREKKEQGRSEKRLKTE